MKPAARVPDTTPLTASDEPIKAMKKFVLPAGFKVEPWATEPMLGNPVAFTIDEQGRIYVAETYRYRTSTLDIRHYMFMLEDDMAIRNVEERMAMTKKHFGDSAKDLAIE